MEKQGQEMPVGRCVIRAVTEEEGYFRTAFFKVLDGFRHHQFAVVDEHQIRFQPVVFFPVEFVDALELIVLPLEPVLVGQAVHLGVDLFLPAFHQVMVIDGLDFSTHVGKHFLEGVVKPVSFGYEE